MCVEMFRNFARPGLYGAVSLVPCFEMEGSGLRLAAFTVLPVDDVAVAESMALVCEGGQWENQKVPL
jgi:hypothetical protein